MTDHTRHVVPKDNFWGEPERFPYGRTIEEVEAAVAYWRKVAAENEAEFRRLGLVNRELSTALKEAFVSMDTALGYVDPPQVAGMLKRAKLQVLDALKREQEIKSDRL